MKFFTDLPRDDTLLANVEKSITAIEKSRKLSNSECLILRECVSLGHPYPTHLMSKIGDASNVFLEEWKAFENLIVTKVIGRELSTIKEAFGAIMKPPKFWKGENMTFEECLEHGYDYPDYLFTKFSFKEKEYLLQERTLFLETREVVGRAISGTMLPTLNILSSYLF
jgi:hypothetical protein